MTFTTETRVLPVLWHQSLLVLAQRYRGDITRRDKDRLKEVRMKQILLKLRAAAGGSKGWSIELSCAVLVKLGCLLLYY